MRIFTDFIQEIAKNAPIVKKLVKSALLLDFLNFLCYNAYVIRIYDLKYINIEERSESLPWIFPH